jgi:hypothetical protein
MAHLIFGSSVEAFQDVPTAVNTCFEMLLGNIDVNADLRALGGLQVGVLLISAASCCLGLSHGRLAARRAPL